ncbi:unnamed protein product, partial [Closterium sp. NIES-53]
SSCIEPQILRIPSFKSDPSLQDDQYHDHDQHDAASGSLQTSGNHERSHQSIMDTPWPSSQLHQRRDDSEFQESQRLSSRRPEERPETPESRLETPENWHETPENRPGSGDGGGRGKQRDGKKLRVVQYPYKPLLPRDGFSWVKYGQKKLTTGDNMI